LDAIADEVEQRLAQSLHFAIDALLNLPKADRPGQVEPSTHVVKPWAIAVEDDRRSGFVLLPEDETIVQVFGRSRRQLLILGEPGSGKTTSMLEIGRELLTMAQRDNQQPIPVLLNLSSWKKEQPILDWAVADLNAKYGVSTNLGREWLVAGRLFPLLDGLDEVRTDWQLDCAGQLNGWMMGDLAQRPVGLVVCCRVEEYERVVRQKLALWWAVCLQPLELVQIEAYLMRFGLGAVASSVVQDESLRELLEQPLFLSMFGLVAQQGLFDLADWQARKTPVAMQEYLFDQYWVAVMERDLVSVAELAQGKRSKTYGKRKMPSEETVRRSLMFVAKGMGNETELLIESIQPDWLLLDSQKFYYYLVSVLGISLISVALITPINILFHGVIGEDIIRMGFFSGLLGIFRGVETLISFSELNRVKPVEKLSFTMPALKSMRHLLIPSLIIGLFVGFLFNEYYGSSVSFLYAFIAVLIVNLTTIITVGTRIGQNTNIQPRIRANQGIKNAAFNMLISAAPPLILMAASRFSMEYFSSYSSFSAADIKMISLLISVITGACLTVLIGACIRYVGGKELLQHFALRLILWLNGYAPPRYDKLLNYCTERMLLQRVGGRYRFMHRTLQEYFAKMDLD
jgi:DNA polymerase III delta prime subunit